MVNLIGFYRISKAIGGITVNLCHAVDDTAAHNAADRPGRRLRLQDAARASTSSTACRRWSSSGSATTSRSATCDRVERQRYFLTAAFRKIASAGILLDPGKLGDLVSAVDKSIYVDQS